jgi:hypothetical protein
MGDHAGIGGEAADRDKQRIARRGGRWYRDEKPGGISRRPAAIWTKRLLIKVPREPASFGFPSSGNSAAGSRRATVMPMAPQGPYPLGQPCALPLDAGRDGDNGRLGAL